jgi:hypothetical protein
MGIADNIRQQLALGRKQKAFPDQVPKGKNHSLEIVCLGCCIGISDVLILFLLNMRNRCLEK